MTFFSQEFDHRVPEHREHPTRRLHGLCHARDTGAPLEIFRIFIQLLRIFGEIFLQNICL